MSEGSDFNPAAVGSLPSFAAQSTNGRNAKNRPFAALVANVSVADKAPFRCGCANGCFRSFTALADRRLCQDIAIGQR